MHPHVPLLHAAPFAAPEQSAPEPHPQTPPLHLLPSGELEQSAAHVPPEQQPPLHSEEALHDVEHLPPLQAVPAGQSPGPLQPHVPPLRHLLPVDAFEQSTQVPPDGPHAELPTAAHCPAMQQ